LSRISDSGRLVSCPRCSQHNAAVILSEIWRIFAPNEVESLP
jgi:hypothetical protein